MLNPLCVVYAWFMVWVPAETPFTYIVIVEPLLTTATCVHVFTILKVEVCIPVLPLELAHTNVHPLPTKAHLLVYAEL